MPFYEERKNNNMKKISEKAKIKNEERRLEKEANMESLRNDEGYDDEMIQLVLDICKDVEPKFVVMFK